MLNFYRRFLPDTAKHQVILNHYFKQSKKNDKALINWTDEATIPFSLCKDDLANAATLVYSQINSTLALFIQCIKLYNSVIEDVLQ